MGYHRKATAAVIALAACLSTEAASGKDLLLARVYRQVVDICIDELLANQSAGISMIKAGRSFIVHCDCMAYLTMGHFSPPEYASVMQGEIPASATQMWKDRHDLCIKTGY